MSDSPQPSQSWVILNKGMTKDDLVNSFRHNRQYTLSKDQYSATINDNYNSLALAIRDRIVERWVATQQRYHKKNMKRVYYLSLEFLIGRLLGNNVYNLGLEEETRAAMEELGFDLSELREEEVDAGLGNGGLGRLAACFLDSMATLGIPCHGYGIRYDYGIFNQKIENGYQVEHPDEWLRLGSPWEFARMEYAVPIKFCGRVQTRKDEQGRLVFEWTDTSDVLAVPYDIPVVGYKNDVVNTLRLWSARGTEDFDFQFFNSGDYESAVLQKVYSENISKVLYPNDELASGQELRLRQQYFFVAASISDIIRRFRSEIDNLKRLPERVVIQLNDTHPTLAIPELMRVLLDENHFDWDTSWGIVQKVFAYTNHTLMPEALERWPVKMMEYLLPRHMQIIYEINHRFLEEVAQQFPGDTERLEKMSIIQEGDEKRVRMAHLAVAGSFSVNGVSALHSDLLKTRVLKDFYLISPEKFNNKTNGITQRRWLYKSNPALSQLITQKIGGGWVRELQELEKLEKFAEDKDFIRQWQAVKLENKKELAAYIERTMQISVDPNSLFDVQVKRIHEYKRQLMFALFILEQYLRIKHDTKTFIQPRTFIIGGKAAPGYRMAKLIIKFINNIAHVINSDKGVKGLIKVVYLENYRVSLAERIFPASELSEQISLAGTEASGTGNMKFMINGALTAGTYDGANIEMAQHAGMENIFIFGLRTHEVEALWKKGYAASEYIESSSILKEIITLIESNYFSMGEKDLFRPLVDSLRWHDQYMICADFKDYCDTQEKISTAYRDALAWNKMSILNVARSGFFSSDRTIKEYAKDIWFK